MKKVDLTKQIMKRVISFEKKRTKRWLAGFFLLVSILGIFFLGFLWIFIKIVVENETLDLLTLFGEDQEMIAQFWQDNLLTFWQEIPHRIFFLTIVSLIVIIILLFLLRKKLRLNFKKIKELKTKGV